MNADFPKAQIGFTTLYPLVWSALSFASGIALASAFTLSIYGLINAAILLSVSACILLQRQGIVLLLLILSFAVCGALSYKIEHVEIASNRLKVIYEDGIIRSGTAVKLTGTLKREPEPSVTGFYLLIAAEDVQNGAGTIATTGVARLFLPVKNEADAKFYRELNLKAGDRITTATELKREERFLNPGVRSTKENLDRQGIDATGTVGDPADIERLSEASISIVNPFSSLRRQLISEFRQNFNVATAGVLTASLLGNKYYLDKPTAEAFRDGGTFHILVISGAHITLIGTLVVWLISFATRNRWILFIASNALLWAFSLAVGGEAPVTRAAVMFTVLSFAYVVQRQPTLLNALGASALALLIWKPSDLLDPSFQLTFACVFAIVGVGMPLWQKMERIGAWYPSAKEPLPPNVHPKLRAVCEALFWNEARWRREQRRMVWQCRLFKSDWARFLERRGMQAVARYLIAAVVISVIVQIWLLPFMVVYFHRVTPSGLILNLFAGIILTAETLCAVFAVLMTHVSQTLAAPFIWLTEALNWLLLHSVDPFRAYSLSNWRLPAYTGWARIVYVLYFVPLILLWRMLFRWDPFALLKARPEGYLALLKPRVAGAAWMVLLAAVLLHPFSVPWANGKLRIDFLDVGQGDSALLTFPDGRTMLIDGGGRFNFDRTEVTTRYGEREEFAPDIPSIGESVVSEFLWNRGLERVDYLVATHPDLDHIQGLNDVAKNFSVAEAFIGAGQRSSKNLEEFLNKLKNIPFDNLERGSALNIGGAWVEVLSPSPATFGLKENNNSIVLRVTLGQRSFLFTGDIEKEAEAALLSDPANLRCDVVKVAHHGSRSSSTEEFIAATGAKTAIISVGRDSPFGHPHREVVERWQNSGAATMTTGAGGTITIVTDGEKIQVKTFLEK